MSRIAAVPPALGRLALKVILAVLERRELVNSPLTEAGAKLATVGALMIGLPLSQGRVERVDGLIVCRGLPKWAYARGGTCVGSVYLTGNVVSDRVLRHERIHVDQWKKYGLLFPVLYWLAGSDPLKNHFEIEAGLEDGGYVRRSVR